MKIMLMVVMAIGDQVLSLEKEKEKNKKLKANVIFHRSFLVW